MDCELPTVDGPTDFDRVDVPLYGVFMRETDRGDLLEATCPECMNASVIEQVHGRCVDYRCGCGATLRVLG